MAAAKAAQNLLIAAKKNAAWHLPGRVAKKIMPAFPGNELQRPKTVIAVTGTDGKTTVCNMLCDLFTSMGYRVVCNNMGFNEMCIRDSFRFGGRCSTWKRRGWTAFTATIS